MEPIKTFLKLSFRNVLFRNNLFNSLCLLRVKAHSWCNGALRNILHQFAVSQRHPLISLNLTNMSHRISIRKINFIWSHFKTVFKRFNLRYGSQNLCGYLPISQHCKSPSFLNYNMGYSMGDMIYILPLIFTPLDIVFCNFNPSKGNIGASRDKTLYPGKRLTGAAWL